MDFSSICRTCLGSKYLTPIFKKSEDHNFSATILITTGLTVYLNDGLPQQICKNCMKTLKDFFKFRQLCKDAEIQLLNIKYEQENDNSDIKNTLIEKSRHKKKKVVKTNVNVNNTKIKSDCETDDDRDEVPLLRQKLHFTNTSKTINNSIKLKREFVEINETNEETDADIENNEIEVKPNVVDKKLALGNSVGNKHIIEVVIEENVLETNKQFSDDEPKLDEDELKPNGNEMKTDEYDDTTKTYSESDTNEDCQLETEYLDLNFDSDSDENITQDEGIFQYSRSPKTNTTINDGEMETVKYNDNTMKTNKYKFVNPILEETVHNIKYVTNKTTKSQTIKENLVKLKGNIALGTANSTIANIAVPIAKNKINILEQQERSSLKKNFENNLSETLVFVSDNTEMENLSISIDNSVIMNQDLGRSLKKFKLDNNLNEQKDVHKNRKLTGEEQALKLDENIPFMVLNSKRVMCKFCQQELSRRSIDHHMTKKHPGADVRKEKCDMCDKFIIRERLNRHKVVMHGLDRFRCGYCKTEYGSKETLIQHVISCTAKKQKRKDMNKRKEVLVECDICNKAMQKTSLKLHKEIKHAGLRPVCEYCGHQFGNKSRLTEHLRARHGMEKYKCSMCDFRCANVEALRNHERRHRGEKPFMCKQCDAKFHAAHLLIQHRHTHRAERNMKCDQCPAAFKSNNTLHMHKTTCHNTNVYLCPTCPRTYNSRQYVVKHLRTVHRHTGPIGPIHVRPKVPCEEPKTPSEEKPYEPPVVVTQVSVHQNVNTHGVE